jgi:hypothetical protein
VKPAVGFSRGDPCTQYLYKTKMRDFVPVRRVKGGVSLFPVFRTAAAASDASPVTLRERRPAGVAAGR